MPRAMFFKKPEYCEYIRLLAKLHDLIAVEQDEGSEGELLRGQMDVCSENFSDDEIASLNGISGDMYSLTEPPIPPFLRTAQVQANLWTVIQARQTGDSVTALELLRQNRSMIDPSQLSYLRGRIFSDVGLDDIAVRFFEHASQLEPAAWFRTANSAVHFSFSAPIGSPERANPQE